MAYKQKNRSAEEAEYCQKIGNRIKVYRKAKGITQLDLAMSIGVNDPVTIGRYEAGQVAMPVYRLEQIAKQLDTEIIHLLPHGISQA